jgi:hypothetical protein
MLLSILTYLAQAVVIFVSSAIANKWLGQQDTIIGLLSCILVFGVELAALSDSPEPVWHPYVGSYVIALVFEPVIAVVSFLFREKSPCTPVEVVDTLAIAIRYFCQVLIVSSYFYRRKDEVQDSGSDSERQSLLQKSSDSHGGVVDASDDADDTYGSTTYTSSNTMVSPADNPESPWERRERQANEQMEKRLKENGNWFTYAKSFLVSNANPFNSAVSVQTILMFEGLLPVHLACEQQATTDTCHTRRNLSARQQYA